MRTLKAKFFLLAAVCSAFWAPTAQAAYNCATTLLGISQANYALSAGAIDPFSPTNVNFAALGLNVACNRSGADSRRSEDLAVTVQISAGASGSAAARALATPVNGVNQYNYYTDAGYSNPYQSVNIGTMSWGGNFLFGDTSTQQLQTNLFIQFRPSPTNFVGVYSDTVTLTISIGNRFVFQNTITLQAEYLKNCRIETPNPSMNFGAIAATAAPGAFATQTSNVNVRCTRDTAFNLGLTAGQSGNELARAMSDTATGSVFLPYELSRDAGFASSLQSAGENRFSAAGLGLPQTLTIFGRVPLAQSFITPGSYTDTTTLILEY